MRTRTWLLLALLLCACKEESEVGAERGPCYPNNTCNQGLTCASGLCVRLSGGDLGRVDATGDGVKGSDGTADRPRKADGPVSFAKVSTVTGGAGSGFEDGPLASARFLAPAGLALDGKKLYVADRDNHRVRLIDLASGQVSTVAGNGTPGYLDAVGTSAMFNAPTGLALASGGKLLVADAANHRIRSITAGAVSTVAGSGNPGFVDGPVATASLSSPRGVTADPFGAIYVADFGSGRLRKISAGHVAMVASGMTTPLGVAVDVSGAALVSDLGGHRIWRLVAGGGNVTPYAGTSVAGFNDGDAAWAQFNGPAGIALRGNILYIADTYNHRIRRLENDKVSTIAGTGKSGSQDGSPTTALFNLPYGVAADDAGNIYVADTGNNSIRRIAP